MTTKAAKVTITKIYDPGAMVVSSVWVAWRVWFPIKCILRQHTDERTDDERQREDRADAALDTANKYASDQMNK